MRKLIIGASALAAACSAPGSVTFTTWGEEFIEDRIPSEAFEDGWELRYSKFLVVLNELQIANHANDVAARQPVAKVFDLHRKGPVVVDAFPSLPAEEWDEVSFAIHPSATAIAGNADESDVALLRTSGYAIYVEATATKGATTKSLKWGFTTDTLYEKCDGGAKGPGVTVPSGGSETVEITVHGDHLFYDDLQRSEAKMRFDPIAQADANGDGEVTLAELGAVDLTALPLGTYGTGGASGVHTLKDFVTALTRTLGHYRGEGECTPRAR